MIDSHCHLDLPAFADDLSAVVDRARQHLVSGFLIPGTTAAGWQRQLKIQAQYSDIHLAFGWHPWFLPDDFTIGTDALITAVQQHRNNIIAIGEIGLDATIDTPLTVQERWFERQLQVAADAKLPVILHHLKTHHRLPAIIRQNRFTHGGVVHAFAGNADVARQYIDAGFKLGVGGTITYPRGEKTRQAIKQVGLEHILLETDSPDMPMQGFQGQRNEPARLMNVVLALTDLFDCDAQTIIDTTSANFTMQFGLSQGQQ